MKRATLYFLLLLFLTALAAVVLVKPRLPAIAAVQMQQYLQPYGVTEIQMEGPVYQWERISFDRISLRGAKNGLDFQLMLSAIGLDYSWRSLLAGQFGALTLEDLTLAVEDSRKESGSSAGPLDIEQILPQPYIESLPLLSVDIKAWQLDYRSPVLPAIHVNGSMQVQQSLVLDMTTSSLATDITAHITSDSDDNPLTIVFQLGNADSAVLQLDARAKTVTTGTLQWRLEGELGFAALLRWLPEVAGAMAATEITSGLSAADLALLERVTLQGNTRFRADLEHPTLVNTSSASLEHLLAELTVRIDLQNHIERLDYDDSVEGFSGQLDTLLTVGGGQWQVQVQPTILRGSVSADTLQLTEEQRRWLRWGKWIPFSWELPEPVSARSTTEQAWSVHFQNSRLTVESGESGFVGFALGLEASSGKTTDASLALQLEGSLATSLRKQQLPQMEFSFAHSGSVNDGAFSLLIADMADSLSLSIEGKGRLSLGEGRHRLNLRSLDLPYTSRTVLPLLRKFNLLQHKAEIVDGSFSLQSEIVSTNFDQTNWKVQSHLQLQALSGSVGEYRFDNVAANARWHGLEKWRTMQPIELTMEKVNIGVELTNVRAMISLPTATAVEHPVVLIEQLSADMFGGRAFLPKPQTLDFSAHANSITLRAEHWQLSDLVALQHDQQIEAKGDLEGELPLTIVDGRVIINGGYLSALAPGGNIRYQPSAASQALASGSADLGMALELLENFQYEVLRSDVELDQQGNLILGLSLGGNNPAYYEGRRINFNINLEQNLDPLLQSLRLSDTLVEQIEKNLK